MGVLLNLLYGEGGCGCGGAPTQGRRGIEWGSISCSFSIGFLVILSEVVFFFFKPKVIISIPPYSFPTFCRREWQTV